MKIVIEYVAPPFETELTIKCSNPADATTKQIIQNIQNISRDVLGSKDGAIHKFTLAQIFYIESVDEKTFLYLANDIFETDQRLYMWEAQLEHTSFVRISKSTILNTDKLESIRSMLGGKMEATMQNGEKLIISRHYLSAFRKKFGI
ncbi:LytTR family transcriptional regulator DNA-binding domain-containing protein [Fusibacter paucivorans]|uniref:LytTR family transcriptional regulator DNA-binding domain-containing protein n=1 Tax=Fusibacter paucivorans TaxID=76009 RepID=A0ABS5PNL3_9FIRM|nr:LytTR family DNA-binding domain-containing protein [Fusibacter paucivorans]MBS7525964.1 LytTR family transcriptional regulator DNA-binding domain-containing protein [Fusibacter paucivorans]